MGGHNSGLHREIWGTQNRGEPEPERGIKWCEKGGSWGFLGGFFGYFAGMWRRFGGICDGIQKWTPKLTQIPQIYPQIFLPFSSSKSPKFISLFTPFLTKTPQIFPKIPPPPPWPIKVPQIYPNFSPFLTKIPRIYPHFSLFPIHQSALNLPQILSQT